MDPYPIEYEILSLNPPVPDLPRVPPELDAERSKVHLPTDDLVRKHLKRRDRATRSSSSSSPRRPLGGDDDEEEERAYASLLGVPLPPDKSTAMGRKAGVLHDAYEFAVRQRELLRTNEGMSERESVKIVEELLSKERREERFESRRKANEVKDWRRRRDEESKREGGDKSGRTTAARDVGKTSVGLDSSSPSSAVPSILHSKPRTLLAMNVWSSRLRAVPYHRWTVGAATALDHWIASDVLEYDERTWEGALNGGTEEEEDPTTGVVGATTTGGRMRDLVTVRGALFPETLASGAEEEGVGTDEEEAERAEEAFEAMEEETTKPEKKRTAADASIQELLERLGEFDDDDEDDGVWNFDDDGKNEEGTKDAACGGGSNERRDEEEEDVAVSDLVDELQGWRRKHVERPYEEWNTADKEGFNKWLGKYLAVVASDANEEEEVDVVATRQNLLSIPPSTHDESDAFWDSIKDETDAEMFLQSLLEDARKEEKEDAATNDDDNDQGLSDVRRKQKSDRRAFLSLPYDVQLRKLIDLGTLRPMFDEYATEKDRTEFLSRHGESLLEGTDVEHLVPDPNGPISFEDVEEFVEERAGRSMTKATAAKRYRIEKIKYGTDEYGTRRSERARILWRIWNEHKVGRARYEETMFKRGKLGLQYLSVKSKKRRGRKYNDLL